MHQLYTVISDVEKTHPGLGNALAMAAICVKARMCFLMIAPAGTGKSVVGRTIAGQYPDSISIDSVTRSGLRDFREEFTNFWGLVVIDDIAKVDSDYSRKHTITSFAELCYSHFIEKHTFSASVVIHGFFGSAIINVQPVVLGALVADSEWEAVTQDKTFRYYHLYRPRKPVSDLPKCNIDWGISLDSAHAPRHDYRLYDRIEKVAGIQWSDARVLEHVDVLLRAVAAMDRRQDCNIEDYRLLYRLMKPMTVERSAIAKYSFESGRYMDTNLLATLVEFASWPNVSIERISRDYKIAFSTTYRLLSELHDWFEPSEPMSKKLVPKRELIRVLREAGVER